MNEIFANKVSIGRIQDENYLTRKIKVNFLNSHHYGIEVLLKFGLKI